MSEKTKQNSIQYKKKRKFEAGGTKKTNNH